MMIDKVVDNNESKTLSKVKQLHGEFIFATFIGWNGPEHSDSALPYAKYTEIA